MNTAKQNLINKKSGRFKITTLVFLCLFFLAIQCAGLPVRKFQRYDFSPSLNTKEFLPAKPKWLPTIVIYEPVLLKEKVLLRTDEDCEAGLIASLNDAGFTVYLISSKDSNFDFKQHALELDSILNQIGDKHKNRDMILGGASLGGQTILEYMTLPTNLTNYARVKKIFFIGTGIDYNYTNSFAEKSENLGYENKVVKNLCKEKKTDNFCTRYIRFNNNLQNINNSEKEEYFNRIPKIEKDYISRFHKSKLQLPYFFLYGKLDSISPEESIYPLFHKIKPSASGDSTNTLYEAGEANGHSRDYDHADLFLFENANKEIYAELVKWLQKNN